MIKSGIGTVRALFDFIVAHGDEDGVCAAAILERYSPGARILISGPRELSRVLLSIPAGSTVVIADIALPMAFGQFGKVTTNYRVFYIDHHPLPPGVAEGDLGFQRVYRDLSASASEIAFREFGGQGSEPLAIYGAIGDYMDDTPTVRELMSKQDKRTVYYEAAMIGYALSEKHEPGFSARLAHYLADKVRPGLIRGLDELAVYGLRHEYEIMDFARSHGKALGNLAYVENPPIIGYAGKAAFYAMGYLGKPVGVCVTEREDSADLVLRSDGTLDVGSFSRSIAQEFGAEGGGHRRAASISVRSSDVDRVLRALREAADGLVPSAAP